MYVYIYKYVYIYILLCTYICKKHKKPYCKSVPDFLAEEKGNGHLQQVVPATITVQ